MTRDLQAQRSAAASQAQARNERVTVELSTHGVRFGTVVANPGGPVEVHAEGVGADLVVRPFGWKGTVARLRRFVEDAARIHFGIQSSVLIQQNQWVPNAAHLGRGQSWWDPDDDGKARELEEGGRTAGACHLA